MKRYLTIGAVVILLLVVLFGWLVPFGIFKILEGGNLAKPTGALGRLPKSLVSNSCITPILPHISDEKKFADAINQYVNQLVPRSPLNGLGADFVKAGIQYGINPAWLINIARKESSFGIHIPPDTFNSYGRTATDSQPHINFKGRNWYKYDSFSQSAYGQAEYLRRRFIDQGLTTFETITPVYAPPSENATQAYITEIKEYVGTVVALAGDSLVCQSNGSASAFSSTIEETAWLNEIKISNV